MMCVSLNVYVVEWKCDNLVGVLQSLTVAPIQRHLEYFGVSWNGMEIDVKQIFLGENFSSVA